MIIGLGYRNRVGKTTIADILVNQFGFTKISFATPIKELCDLIVTRRIDRTPQSVYEKKLNRWAKQYGLKTNTIVFEQLVNMDIPQYCFYTEGSTGKYRKLLMYVATDMFRNNISEDFWVDAAFKIIDPSGDGVVGKHIVIDDMRFKNEKKRIKSYQGIFVHINNINMGKIDKSVECLELAHNTWDYKLETGVEIKDPEDSADPGICELTKRVASMLQSIN